ncbi:MAG: hypothetical protein H6698_05165 [Myxococcales bacterium]|nr:hypothetical protein [Myxococcales bacterium]MCB9519753.1 hypothetical protein [Myxococcales bacterium]MCB9530444.1 hypothetical protein [Myxococcales bacterium]MCB9533692.1 hypothetical protein [Myxococcales bacterium]
MSVDPGPDGAWDGLVEDHARSASAPHHDARAVGDGEANGKISEAELAAASAALPTSRLVAPTKLDLARPAGVATVGGHELAARAISHAVLQPVPVAWEGRALAPWTDDLGRLPLVAARGTRVLWPILAGLLTTFGVFGARFLGSLLVVLVACVTLACVAAHFATTLQEGLEGDDDSGSFINSVSAAFENAFVRYLPPLGYVTAMIVLLGATAGAPLVVRALGGATAGAALWFWPLAFARAIMLDAGFAVFAVRENVQLARTLGEDYALAAGAVFASVVLGGLAATLVGARGGFTVPFALGAAAACVTYGHGVAGLLFARAVRRHPAQLAPLTTLSETLHRFSR